MWPSSGTYPTPETMASSDPSHGTPNHDNALSHLDAAPSIENGHETTEKPASASAEETLPSPPQQESLGSRPNTIPASETRASSREPTMERTIYVRSGSDSPISRLSSIHERDIAAEANVADGTEHLPQTDIDRMQIDEALDEQKSSSAQTSPHQAESCDSISSSIAVSEDATSFEVQSDVAKEEEPSQLPKEPIPQEHRLPEISPSLKEEAQEGLALDMYASVPEQPSSAEAVRDTPNSPVRYALSALYQVLTERYMLTIAKGQTRKLTNSSIPETNAHGELIFVGHF